jgi:DNA repair exonuclease SbcCD nuclease subunit
MRAPVGSTPTSLRQQQIPHHFMRFLHTSDWHIGHAAGWAGERAPRFREARLEAARRVTQLARDKSAEFVLLAGDLFENHGLPQSAVLPYLEALDSAGCPVYIIPGNHDPDSPGALWTRSWWPREGPIRVLREREPMPLAGGTLYPCPLERRWSDEASMDWIPARREEDGIRIALVHGSLESLRPGEVAQHPIARDAPARYGLDYVALGDWHSTLLVPGEEGPARMAYSGGLELTAIDERDAGNVLLVEIAAPGAAPRIETHHCGLLSAHRLARELRHEGDLERVVGEVRALASDTALIELRLSGVLFGAEAARLEELRAIARVETAALIPAGAAFELPGYYTEVEGRLKAAAENGDPASARALLELYRLAREVA